MYRAVLLLFNHPVPFPADPFRHSGPALFPLFEGPQGSRNRILVMKHLPQILSSGCTGTTVPLPDIVHSYQPLHAFTRPFCSQQARPQVHPTHPQVLTGSECSVTPCQFRIWQCSPCPHQTESQAFAVSFPEPCVLSSVWISRSPPS